MQIRCVGQLTIDDIVLPDGTVRMETMGGNALYSASGAMLWLEENEVAPVTCAGRDYPVRFMKFLQERGVDCSYILQGEYAHMRSWILYEKNRERRSLCRNEEVLPYPPISEESFHQYFEVYRRLHLQASPLLSDFQDVFGADAYHLAPQSYERHAANITLLRERVPDAVISLDPSPFYMHHNNREQMAEILKQVDIVMPSREEVFSCFGEIAPQEAAKKLCSMGPHIAVIKLGAEGAFIYDDSSDKGFIVPSVSDTVVDTTGGGDAFCGGFLSGYLKTKDLLWAACCGAVSAAYAIADYGPDRILIADREEAAKKQEQLYALLKG